MNYKISQIQDIDIHELKKLIKLLKVHENNIEPLLKTDKDSIDRMFEVEMIGKNKYIYCVRSEKCLVGFIAFEESMKIDPLVAESTPALYITAIFIKENHRKKGLAKKLIKVVEDFALKKDIRFIKLLTFSKNQLARDFYFQDGFEDYESTMIKQLF